MVAFFRLLVFSLPGVIGMFGCSSLVNSFAFHPERLSETVSAPSDPRIEEHFFSSLDGTRLHGLVFPSL